MNLALPRAEFAPTRSPAIALTGGHSGAEVLLYTDDSDTWVRKSAAASAGNARLLRQALKQRLFAAQGLPFPHVRELGFDAARRAWFEMDYVPARTLGDLVRSQVAFDRGIVIRAVDELLAKFRLTATKPLPAELFLAKIAEIGRFSHDASLHRAAARLSAMDWSGIPASASHGDLTFENILVAPDGSVVFIDCDEPFASSWHLDLGKLFQDAAGHWCIRTAPSIGAAEKLAHWARDFGALAPECNARLAQFAALHLLRTVPYARSDDTASFAVRAALRLLELD
jgi:aminoglycoside phosphotransferase